MSGRISMLSFLLLLQVFSWFTVTGGFGPTRTAAGPHQYDVIIIGAGASGLFASGAARMAGQTCCLIEASRIGGDCTNAACVPSKALRSVAPQFAANFGQARRHMDATVGSVRAREDPDRIGNVTDLYFGSCRFVGPHEVEVAFFNASESTTNSVRLLGKRFLLATGASPVVPKHLKAQAATANLPILTYRSLLNPEQVSDPDARQFLEQLERNSNSKTTKNVLIVGGGANACELGSSLAQFQVLNITLVAPALLPNEDARLQEAALNILLQAGVQSFRFNAKVAAILPDKRIQLDDGSILSSSFDAVLMCVGRSPGSSLQSLNLEAAGIHYSEQDGVLVNSRTLQSVSASHVYAAGDCASAIPSRLRTASQAAWTGFHAVRNLALPRILTMGGTAVHSTVPRIIYTQPEELACVGMTLAECIQKYGTNGFDVLFCPEEGSDRADMDSQLRDPRLCFVELRATKKGRILGLTACGPTAAEIANAMSLAIASKLTTRDVARSVFGYPSHGYLLHRVGLSMALKDISGLLDACGPVARLLGVVGRSAAALGRFVRAKRASKSERLWQSAGTQRVLYPDHVTEADGFVRLQSYHAVWSNATLKRSVETLAANRNESNTPVTTTAFSKAAATAFLSWEKAR